MCLCIVYCVLALLTLCVCVFVCPAEILGAGEAGERADDLEEGGVSV